MLMSRKTNETFWDEFMLDVYSRAKANDQFRDSSFDGVRLTADAILTLTSLMLFSVFVWVLHVTLYVTVDFTWYFCWVSLLVVLSEKMHRLYSGWYQNLNAGIDYEERATDKESGSRYLSNEDEVAHSI